MPESVARLTVAQDDDRLTVVGDLDAHTCPDLEANLDPLPGSGDIHLDLSGVDFMDSSGLRVIIGTHQRTIEAGRRLIIERPSTSVQRIIEISGLTDHLHIVAAD